MWIIDRQRQDTGMQRRRSAGFTLIELMITVIVLGILVAIAVPAYTNYVLKGNRAVAKAKLLDVAARQETYFGDNKVYTNSLAFFGFSDITMGVDDKSNWVEPDDASAIYVISLALTNGGMGYTATADTANRQTQDDARCATFTVTNTGQRDATGSLGVECWK